MATVAVTSVTGAPGNLPPEVTAAVARALGDPAGRACALGSFDAASFKPGAPVPTPTEAEVAEAYPGRRAHALAAELFGLLAACSAEVVRLRAQRARADAVHFGPSSERLSTLDPELAAHAGADPVADADVADSVAEVADGVADGATCEGGETGKEKGGKGTCKKKGDEDNKDKGEDKDKDKDKDKDEQKPKAKGKGTYQGRRRDDAKQPTRAKGCADALFRDALRVTTHRAFDEGELAALDAMGAVRIDDGSYREAHLITLAVYEDATYERRRVRETGEVRGADSAEAAKPMAKSPVGWGLLAEFLHERYVTGLTGPKVAARAVTAGLGITTQTIYRVCTQSALAVALPVVARLLQRVTSSGAVMSDETWVRVRQDLAEEGRRNSVLWLVRTSDSLEGPPAVVLAYTGTRASEALEGLLAGIGDGAVLMADGFSSYPAALAELPGEVELAGCLQHSRARFVDAEQALRGSPEWDALGPEGRAKTPVAKILAAFAEVFRLEAEMPGPGGDGAAEARRAWRESKVIPALDELFEVIERYRATPLGELDDYLGDALRYACAHKERFYAAARRQDCSLTNSACERSFADLATIRNASRQIDGVAGAWALSLWFSVTRTARANGADELCYLNYLMERARPVMEACGDWSWPARPKGGWQSLDFDGMLGSWRGRDLSYLDELMPWSDGYREYAAGWAERRRLEALRLVANAAPPRPKCTPAPTAAA